MQIEIKLIPYYEQPFSRLFPGITEFLHQLSRHALIEKEVSLYDLIDHVVTLNNDPRLPPSYKEKIGSHVLTLLSLKRRAREHLLSRRLNDLDRVLYKIEDAFEELEAALS
jgi:hypothetical protein